MAAPHAFLDVLANSQIRDAYLAGRISIILTSDLETILWTNGAGAHFMGMRTVAETIGVESGFDRLTRHQIEAGLEVSQPVRVSGIAQNAAFLVNETHLPPLGKVVFLRSVKGLVDQEGSANLIEGLSDETTAAALFDLSGHIMQASHNFDSNWFESQELQQILTQAHHERRVKKCLLQKNPAMTIGVLELNHDPAVFLLIAAKVEEIDKTPAPSSDDFAFDPTLLPLRFGWRINEDGFFEEVSSELEQAVGRQYSDIVGKSFAQLALKWNMDGDGTVRALFKSHNAWGGHKVYWPVEGSETRVGVTFYALPVYSRAREFVGFRGFALIEASMDQEIAASTPDRQAPPKGLSAQEHETFSIIARTLQAHLQEQEPPQPTSLLDNIKAALTTFSPTALNFELSSTSPFAPSALWAMFATEQMHQPCIDVSFLQNLPLSILIYRDEKVLLASDHLLQVTGFPTLDSFRVHGVLSLILRDWLPKNILQGARGESLPIRAQMRSIVWIDGQAASMICFVPDTQRSVDHLQNIQKKAIELSTLLNLVSDGVLIVDEKGIIHSLNDGAKRLFKRPPEAMYGQSFKAFFAQSQHEILDQAFNRICQGAKIKADAGDDAAEMVHVEMQDQDNAQSRRILQVKFSPMEVDDGYYLLLRDVSAMHALSHYKNIAEKKQPLPHFTHIDHQIRTPLTAIVGLAQLILAEKYGPLNNDRYRAYLSDIASSGEHIMRLLQHIDAPGKSHKQNAIELEIRKLNLVAIFNEVLNQIAKQASERRIIIRTSLAADSAPILADARACRQMMSGLLASALHLTPAGGQIIVSIQNMAPKGVLFRIRDTGSGLRAAEMAALSHIDGTLDPAAIWQDWEKNLHLDPLPAKTHSQHPVRPFSAPTVLATTKKLAEANKAQFKLRSEPDKGTLVEIIFPFA